MNADWHQMWEEDHIPFHQGETNTFLRAHYRQWAPDPDAPILVPLAGKSHDIVWLRQQGHRIVACELSPIAVADFFEEHNLRYERTTVRDGVHLCHAPDPDLWFYCGDYFDLTPKEMHGAAAVYDRAALVALGPNEREAYVRHTGRLLAPRANGLLLAFEYPQAEMSGPPYSVPAAEIRRRYAAAGFDTVKEVERVEAGGDDPRLAGWGISALAETVWLFWRTSGSAR